MSDLFRLRELAVLLQPKREPVVEAKSAKGDFKGIQAVVTDALDDLNDKLGEGGQLESLMDNLNLTDLDKHKDRDGFTVLERLADQTKKYRKEIDSLMTEIELMFESSMMESTHVAEGKHTKAEMIEMVRQKFFSTFKVGGQDLSKTVEPIARRAIKEAYEVGFVDGQASVNENLNEMAKAHEYMGGAFYRKRAKEMIRAFKEDGESFELKNGESYVADKKILGSALQQGMIVFAVHDKYNTGAELYEILGFGPDSGPKYKSVVEAMKAVGVKNLKELEDWNQDHRDTEEEVRMHVKDLDDGKSGPWFYVYEKRWAYGSGGEPLSFMLVKKVS